MANEEELRPAGELLVYQGPGLDAPMQVRLEGQTLWLSQKQMAELYGTTVANINQHTATIYEDGELKPEATIKKYLIVQTEGIRQVKRLVDHYNLDMILAVGFRVRSRRGSQFRQWAMERLGEYLVKGFTMDDARLKGQAGASDYFDELLERIRDIRASEARVYLMVRNIFALAADYEEGEQHTQQFFATMQNKMHFAATGLTAAEIIQQRADGSQPNMGLTSWKGARVSKADTGTAKNYLDAQEIDTLNRTTVMFLDQAEFRAQRRQTIHMADWAEFLDKFLADVELPLLHGAGRVSHTRYQQIRRYVDRAGVSDWMAVDDHPERWAGADRDKLVATDSSMGLSAPSAHVHLAAALGNTAHAWAVANTMADLLTLPRVGRSETFADLVRWVEWWACSYLTAVTLEPAEVARLKAGRWWPPVVSTTQISDMPPAIARKRIP